MSETTDTTTDTGTTTNTTTDTTGTSTGPGDGTPVNEVPDAPTVVDSPSTTEEEPVGDDVREELRALKARVADLEDAQTAPTGNTGGTAPAAGEDALIGKVVTWEETDPYGNTRAQFGVVLGEHEIQEGKLNVAVLTGSYDRAYDAADLSVLGS